jgi:hypothetical protein
MHRAVRLARVNPKVKVLVLAPETGGVALRVTTASFRGIAERFLLSE